MTLKSLIILSVVALLLVGCLITADHLRCGESDGNPLLVTIDVDAVDSLRIEYADTTVLIVRDGSMWRMAVPVADDAAYPVIQDILTAAKHAVIHRSFEPGDSWETYGLSPERATLLLKNSSAWIPIYIGDSTPSEEFRYIRRGDEPIVTLVAVSTADRMIKRLKDIRSRELIAMKGEEIERIQWNISDRRMTVERFGNDWTMTEPTRCRADGERINAFVRSCNMPVVTDFIPCSSECMEIREQGSYMVVTGINGTKSETLWVNTVTIPVQALKSGRPDILVLGGEDAEDIPKDTNDWRDHRLIPFYSHRVNMVKISTQGGSGLRFQRLESGWYMDDVKIASDRITGFIRTMEDCTIDSFLPDSEAPDPAYTKTVCVWSADGDSVVLGFGTRKGSSFTVTVSDLTPAALATCIDPDSLSMDIESWRDRRLATVLEYDVEMLEFDIGTEIARARRSDFGEWDISENWPSGIKPSECIASLNTVRIRRHTAEPPDTTTVLSEGTLRIAFTEYPSRSIDLILRTDDVLYAATEEEPMVSLDAIETDELFRLVAAFGRENMLIVN